MVKHPTVGILLSITNTLHTVLMMVVMFACASSFCGRLLFVEVNQGQQWPEISLYLRKVLPKWKQGEGNGLVALKYTSPYVGSGPAVLDIGSSL